MTTIDEIRREACGAESLGSGCARHDPTGHSVYGTLFQWASVPAHLIARGARASVPVPRCSAENARIGPIERIVLVKRGEYFVEAGPGGDGIGDVIERWCEVWWTTSLMERRLYMITEHRNGARCWVRGGEVLRGPKALALLWALALEIDAREATVAGEVCRACGGRGEVIVAACPGRHVPPPLMATASLAGYEVRGVTKRYGGDDSHGWVTAKATGHAIVVAPCPCYGPTRPHTIFLRRLVEDLAALPRPRFAWPGAWLVALDKREAEGLDWIGRWWLALLEWTVAGKLPDASALAEDLAELLPELEARAQAKRERAKRAALWLDDPERPVLRTLDMEIPIDRLDRHPRGRMTVRLTEVSTMIMERLHRESPRAASVHWNDRTIRAFVREMDMQWGAATGWSIDISLVEVEVLSDDRADAAAYAMRAMSRGQGLARQRRLEAQARRTDTSVGNLGDIPWATPWGPDD